MTRVGIVGCGTIGTALAVAIERDYAEHARVVALTDTVRDRALSLQQQLRHQPPIVQLSELIRRSQLVIEAATVSIAARVASLALAANRSVMIMSTGGLLGHYGRLQRLARRSKGRLVMPSGGLCGLDGIKAMAVGKLTRLQLTTRKPPRSLMHAPFVQARGLKLERLRRPTTIFEGTPAEAIRAFPQNTNVSATMAMAYLLTHDSAAPDIATMAVRVVADPTISVNVHELEVEGDCGRIMCRLENRPSANPKTSELAIRSAVATLRQFFEPIRIGT